MATKRQNPYKLTIYVKPGDEKIVRDFIEAIDALNDSASQKIVDYIKQTMAEKKINPQKRLFQYKMELAPQKCRCGVVAIASFSSLGKTESLCFEHMEWKKKLALRYGRVWTEKKL